LDKIKQQAIEKGVQITAAKEKHITIKGVLSNDDYQLWKEQQSHIEYQVRDGHGKKIMKEPDVQYVATDFNSPLSAGLLGLIVKQIKQYLLENSTPMETMLFVQKLKQQSKQRLCSVH
jgi:hypothetical protein